MSRILEYMIPLLLPAGVFVVYAFMTRKTSGEQLEARLRNAPWFWLFIGGVALMAATLSYIGLHEGVEAGGTYHPPRYEDGRIVPGGFD